MSLATGLTALFGPKGPEPSYPALPRVDDHGESTVRGLYLIGEVGGTPLIKLGLNQGADLVSHLRAELGQAPASDPELLDVLIVGAGSSGLGAAMRAHELGMRYVVLESRRVAATVEQMYRGKRLFAEPREVPNRSGVWFEECTREELLERWRRQVEDVGLEVREDETVTDIRPDGGSFTVSSARGTYRARRVLLAVGTAGNPRKAGVPGEAAHGDKVFSSLHDPGEWRDRRILVYGGGDVAVEAALALCRTNRVTLVTIDRALTRPRRRNREAVEAQRAAGRLDLRLASRLVRIDRERVTWVGPDGEEETAANDAVFEMIGADPPADFLRKIGVGLEGDWALGRWVYLAVVSLLVYSLYALKKYPESPYSFPFDRLLPEEGFRNVLRGIFRVAFVPFGWLFDARAYRQILDTAWYQQGYLYSLVYTVAMLVFGYLALRRWSGIAHDDRHQRWRYLSLIAFQVVFFLLVNVVAVQALSLEHSWRAWGLYQPWPLFFHTFHWWSASTPGGVLWGFVGAGLVGTFVAIPIAARNHGKRFCSWICGCGGLAETLGDRWRHLSPKGTRSRVWEFQGVVILVAAALVTLVTVGLFQTRADNVWARVYAYLVDFWLVAVIPIALYPFFGGKIWCRYWCPLAAWNQLLAARYGRLRIVSDDRCISCTLCSRHCQVGVDVMAFARNGEAFDNADTSCIQCGICIDVCPMDVLSFDLRRSGSDQLVRCEASAATDTHSPVSPSRSSIQPRSTSC